MESVVGWLVFLGVLFALSLALLIAWGVVRARARRQEVARWAERRGFTFSPRRDRTIPETFAGFSLFQIGSRRRAYNVASGKWNGRSVLAFDYTYTTGSGEGSHTSNFSAVIMESEIPLEPLSIRPETFLDKLATFFGKEDINFESAQFSREFHVRSPDRRWAYAVLHPRTIEFLLAQPRFWIEMDGRHLIAWGRKPFGAFEFDAALEVLAGILDRIPEYVIQERRGRRG